MSQPPAGRLLLLWWRLHIHWPLPQNHLRGKSERWQELHHRDDSGPLLPAQGGRHRDQVSPARQVRTNQRNVPHGCLSRLHQTRESDTVRIVFAQDRKYNLEETEFDQFSEVSGEIERRTEKRVGTLKNVRSVSSVRGAESHQSKFLAETRFCWTSSLPSIRTFSLLTCQASPELKWTVRTRTLLRRYLTSTSST